MKRRNGDEEQKCQQIFTHHALRLYALRFTHYASRGYNLGIKVVIYKWA
ncbi:MAG: hypothetical protein SQA66_16475 [Candidatus Fervidibacter sacchari]